MGEINKEVKYKSLSKCFFLNEGESILQIIEPEDRASFDYISPSINSKVVISITDKAIQKLPFLNKNDFEKISRKVIAKVKGMNDGEFNVDIKFIEDNINFKSL